MWKRKYYVFLWIENSITTSVLSELFEINKPWYIDSVLVNHSLKEIDLYIKYEKGSVFACPECEKDCKIHDGSFRRWRHLDIIDYKCYLDVKVPRIKCPDHGVKSLTKLPCMRMETHFSLKFELNVMHDVLEMSMSAIAKKIRRTRQ